jgi:tetratricopeptide (TPR) repeat protein
LFLQAWESASASNEDGYTVDAAHMLGIIEPGEEGLEWNLKALALAQASQDPRATRWQGSLYNNMGWTYHSAGDYSQALTMFERAQAAWQSDGELDLVPIATWSQARTLRSLGRVDEALARQMALKEEFDASGHSDGYVSEEIGECLLLLGREGEARPYFARAWSVLSENIWLSASEPERLERLHTLGMIGTGG